ncbi:MAG: HD-GYP domain-containing protein [Chloroflexota bacterium]
MLQKERLAAFLFALAGFWVLALSLKETPLTALYTNQFLLSAIFAGAVILADEFPIHLGRGTKLSMTNLPIYLSAVLLPVSLAVLAVGVGFLTAHFRARASRGYLLRDIALNVGRWMLTTYLGYQVFHLNIPWLSDNAGRYVLLIASALTFLIVDFGSFSLTNSFLLQEPFLHILKSNIADGIVIEVVQYLIGILGALAAFEEIWSLPLLAVPLVVTYFGFKNIKEVHHETLKIMEDMADIVDLRDVYTGGHSRRVADLVHRLLMQLQILGQEATLIENAARVHDIGKIGIPDEILKKPGKLLPEEMAIMRTHSQKGAELVAKYKDFSRGALIILHHHERWDGAGYPARLKEYEIPFGARVIAVADSFDAMTSDRPYRKALSARQAVQVLLEGRGKMWDPKVVNAFVDAIFDQVDDQSAGFPSEQHVSLVISQTVPIPS